MRLVDCVVKPVGQDYWLYHTASSYRVRLDADALGVLEALLARPEPVGLLDREARIFERLAVRGLIAEDRPGHPPGVRILRRSALETIDLEVASRCNLACGHCFAAMDGRTMLASETLDRLVEGVRDLEPVNLVLNGGEPLLNPLWRKVVAAARREGLRVVIMTNGTLVTSEAASYMARQGVAKIAVSLDGPETQHDALRGRGSFRRTVAGIRRLVDRGLQVFVTSLVSGGLLARQQDFERYCLEVLGVTGIRYSEVVPVGKGGTAPGDYLIGDRALRRLHSGRPAGREAPSRPAGRAWSCDAGVEQCFVAADGRVYACHYFQNLGEPLGDLRSGSLGAIYRAGLAGPVARRVPWTELPACRDCPALAACQGGCRARAALLAGSLDARDPHACRIHRLAGA